MRMNSFEDGVAEPVAAAEPSARALFIRRTYGHLAGAILAFVVLEALLFQIPGIEELIGTMTGGMGWAVVLGLFMGVSWVADRWASSDTSRGVQYLGLALYVAAEAVIFLPILYIAAAYYDGIIQQAAVLTLVLFAGLTATAFMSRRDFSFLRPIITIGSMVALGMILAGVFFGFTLGLFFSAAMVLLAAGSILYTTSNILRNYRTDQHVAASLALFAGVALLFWYLLRILMSITGRD